VVKFVSAADRDALFERELGVCHCMTASFWAVMSAVELKRLSLTSAVLKASIRVFILVDVVAMIL